eukprot:365122-Chlamydomonas_euryale.AAC.50
MGAMRGRGGASTLRQHTQHGAHLAPAQAEMPAGRLPCAQWRECGGECSGSGGAQPRRRGWLGFGGEVLVQAQWVAAQPMCPVDFGTRERCDSVVGVEACINGLPSMGGYEGPSMRCCVCGP